MDMIEVGETTRGNVIYRQKNLDIGGWDYVSDSAGNGWIVVDAMASIEELEVIIADMKKMEGKKV